MPDVISAVFQNRQDAENAVRALLDGGISREAIWLVAQDEGAPAHTETRSDGAGKGALAGLTVGAGVGAAIGLASLAIPGVGPLLAAGALVQALGLWGGAAATGAIVGGASGGLAGALSRAGLSEHEARHYASEVERGGVYVGVDLQRAHAHRDAVAQLLQRHNGRLETPPVEARVSPSMAAASPATYAGGASAVARKLTDTGTEIHHPEAAASQFQPSAGETAAGMPGHPSAGQLGVTKHVETEVRHISEPVTHARIETGQREIPPDEQYALDERVLQLKPGETLRIAVVEEELIVKKVPRVVREVVIHARPEVEQVERDIALRREVVHLDQNDTLDEDAPQEVTRQR